MSESEQVNLTLMGQNTKTEALLNRERIDLRKYALEITRSLNLPSASQALEEADKIYDWIIKVL